MIITALVENTAVSEKYGCEHGLSLLIRTQEHCILFDTGQSELFALNAERLGVNLSRVDLAVLSHGHYDHGGGLRRFLAVNSTAPVYLSRCAFEKHYNASGKDIGLDEALAQHPRLIRTQGDVRLDEGITLCSLNGRDLPYPCDPCGLSALEDGRIVADSFRHEQALLIEEGGRRVLISGCSHKGVLNYAAVLKPDVLVGGFHFMHEPIGERLRQYAETLDGFDTEYITCHCTGAEQYVFMQRYLRRLRYLAAGGSITV